VFFYLLDFCLATAPRIFAIISSTGKYICRNFAKLSAWFVRFAHISKDKTQNVSDAMQAFATFLCLLFAWLPRREFLLSYQVRIKTPAAISQNYRLGLFAPLTYQKTVAECANVEQTFVTSFYLLDFCSANRAENMNNTSPIRSVLINEMCLFEVSVRKANAEISAELTSHTSPFCNDYNPLQSFAFRFLCSFFPRAKNCAFIFLTHAQVRLFLTCGSPCV